MGKYDDILALPHHQSNDRASMPMEDRAAQFAPFAVLNGLDDALQQTVQQSREPTADTEKEKTHE